jgi:L-arginine---[L-arginyl-carrier protein] ligase
VTGMPLTAAQTEIWLDEHLSDAGLNYMMADYLDLNGPLDQQIVKKSLQHLVEEAECYRARFAERNGRPVQLIEPAPDWPFPTIDLSAEPDPRRSALRWMEADLDRPLSLADYPLFRFALLRLSTERHFLYICMHHILCDGFSRTVLFTRLAQIYTALSSGSAPDSGRLPSFRVLLDAEAAYAESAASESDREFWAGRFAGTPEPVSLSTAPPARGTGLLRRSTTLPSAAAEPLRAAARRAGVTWAAFAAATVAAYTQRISGASDVMLTLPVTARTGPLSRSVPGMVANYLPLTVSVRPEMSRDDLLRTTSTELLKVLRHQRRRGDLIRKDIGLRLDDRRPFGPFVNVLPQEPRGRFGRCTAEPVNLSTGIVDDIIITVLDGPDGALDLHLNGNPRMY